MSHSRQSNATADARVANAPNADTLVEAYAEDLMDDIFSDVDRILAGDESAVYAATVEPATAVEPTAFKAEAATVPAMIVPLAIGADTAAPITESEVSDTKTGETPPAADDKDKSEKRRPWGKILLGAVCLSALAALGAWWLRQQPTLQTAPAAVPASSDTDTTVSQEAAFGEYLTRSLRVIRGEQSAQVESQQSGGPVASAPTNPVAGNQPAGQPGVIERVFVPLLQPGARPNAGPGQNLPATSLPTPTTQSESADTSDGASNQVPNIAVNSTYELVGILELGDRSAALFEIDGTSQRVYIGETIGASGWNIVSISNEEVVVRRNGDVRSIYIGQKF